MKKEDKIKDIKTVNTESKKFMALAGIKEDEKKFLKNESFYEPNPGPEKINDSKDDDFIILKFEQEKVEPGKDDDELYNLK